MRISRYREPLEEEPRPKCSHKLNNNYFLGIRTNIRKAVPGDQNSISNHNTSMALETEGKHLDPALAVRGVEAVLQDISKGFYLIVEVDGRNVGQCMITYEWSDWRCGNFWWIQSVFVEKEYRKQGIFSNIFQHVMREARRQEGVVGLRLYVEENNGIAKDAYLKLGMTKCHYEMFEMDFTMR